MAEVSVQERKLDHATCWAHRHPFDRMLAARTMLGRISLVTRDPAFADQSIPKPRGPTDCLPRRIGTERAANAGAELGAQGQDPYHPVPLQLDPRIGHRRAQPHQLHVRASRGQHQERAACRVPQGTACPPQAAAADHPRRREGAHRSKLVREYLDSTGGDIQMAFLPLYSPDLNPVEFLWAWLKRHALANLRPNWLNELNTTARNKLRSAQRRPTIIAACWKQAEL